MLDLKGITMRREIARRVASAVGDVLPYVQKDIQREVVFKHVCKTIDLPRRLVPDHVYKKVKSQYKHLEQKKPVSFDEALGWFGQMGRYGQLIKRYEEQDRIPFLPMELNVIRLGNIVFATNCFELFLDFGLQIKARSRAIQTFLIQLCPRRVGSGYLPTLRAVQGCAAAIGEDFSDDGSPAGGARGYEAGIGSSSVGPDGGQVIVEETLKVIGKLWND